VNYADIIFFAIIAIYLGIRLFNVLGKSEESDKVSSNKSSFSIVDNPIESQPDSVLSKEERKQREIDLKKEREEEIENFDYSDEKVKNGIIDIISADKDFSLSEFISGAKMAFEMVFDAYSNKDRETLRTLLSKDVYNEFSSYIDELENDDLEETKSLISVKEKEIESAKLDGNIAIISVLFSTEQINFTKNDKGEVVDGDDKFIEEIEDVWTFERNTKSSNPNWIITQV
jgi:predicted lipid-binding transport protein (Tim44 family)